MALQVYQPSATKVTNHERRRPGVSIAIIPIGALLGSLGDPVIDILVVERYVQPAELGVLEDEVGERLLALGEIRSVLLCNRLSVIALRGALGVTETCALAGERSTTMFIALVFQR